MTYPEPTSVNMSAGLGEIGSYLNIVTFGWFWNLILIGFYAIVIFGYYRATGNFSGAMAVAGFGTFVVSLLFWLGGLIVGWTLAIVLAMTIIGVVVLYLSKN